MTKTMMMLLSSMVIFSKNQMIMVMMIIAVCFTLSMVMFFLSNIHWFSLLMLLIYISGVMVLFMFIVSMAPNEKTLLKKKNSKLMLIPLVLMMSFKMSYEAETLSINSSIEQSIILMFLMVLVILFMAYLPPKIISSFYKGMKSTK